MPVDTLHPEYSAAAPDWRYMRDVVAGQPAVHKAKKAYLAQLYQETEANFEARIARAGFFNATSRTIKGLKGMLFRKPPTFKVSKSTEPMLKDVTKRGVSMYGLAQQVADETLTVGRVGVLVDRPSVETGGKTVQQVERLNLRPHLAMYTAETIINWAESWINNKTVLALVVLQEDTKVDSGDRFVVQTERRWRELDLVVLVDDDGVEQSTAYRQRVWRKSDTGVDEQVGPDVYPMMNGKLMEEIPFQFFGVDDTTPSVPKPPNIDLARVNIGHYQTTADLEHGAHKTALPQPWISGIQTELDKEGRPIKDVTFYMGGGSAWAFPKHETQCGMLEFTGAGLASLENRLEAKQSHMAVLGARMLEEQKAGVEAAETAGIHRSGEQSVLAGHADTLADGFTRVLSWFDEWAGGSGKVEVKVNKDFFTQAMTPEKLTALVAAWQQGAISKESLFEQLQQGEIIRDGVEFAEQEGQIENAAPTLLAQAAAAPEPEADSKDPA